VLVVGDPEYIRNGNLKVIPTTYREGTRELQVTILNVSKHVEKIKKGWILASAFLQATWPVEFLYTWSETEFQRMRDDALRNFRAASSASSSEAEIAPPLIPNPFFQPGDRSRSPLERPERPRTPPPPYAPRMDLPHAEGRAPPTPPPYAQPPVEEVESPPPYVAQEEVVYTVNHFTVQNARSPVPSDFPSIDSPHDDLKHPDWPITTYDDWLIEQGLVLRDCNNKLTEITEIEPMDIDDFKEPFTIPSAPSEEDVTMPETPARTTSLFEDKAVQTLDPNQYEPMCQELQQLIQEADDAVLDDEIFRIPDLTDQDLEFLRSIEPTEGVNFTFDEEDERRILDGLQSAMGDDWLILANALGGGGSESPATTGSAPTDSTDDEDTRGLYREAFFQLRQLSEETSTGGSHMICMCFCVTCTNHAGLRPHICARIADDCSSENNPSYGSHSNPRSVLDQHEHTDLCYEDLPTEPTGASASGSSPSYHGEPWLGEAVDAPETYCSCWCKSCMDAGQRLEMLHICDQTSWICNGKTNPESPKVEAEEEMRPMSPLPSYCDCKCARCWDACQQLPHHCNFDHKADSSDSFIPWKPWKWPGFRRTFQKWEKKGRK